MRMIDRYLVRQFLKSFLIFLIAFTGLFIVIDLFGNLEEFLSYSERQGSLVRVLWDYYGARALALFDRTSGMLTLIAAMFTVTALERHNELTALMAAGISKARIVKPLVGAVVAISLLAVINREVAIPQVQHRLSRNAQDWLGETARKLQPRYDNRTDILLGGQHTLANEQRIEHPSFRLPSGLSQFGSQLAAENAYYKPPSADRPGGYWFKNVQTPANLGEIPSVFQEGGAVVLTPVDTPWLGEGECFVASDVDFEQLEGGRGWRQFSSTFALARGLRNPSLDFGADVRVTIHGRLVQPLLDVTLLFLGLPLVLSRENRNIFAAIGLCLVVVAGFFVVVLACHSLGANYLLSPALAAWCPLLIFVPLAMFLSEPLRG